MNGQPRRPTEQKRVFKRISGEVICNECNRPVGHPHCLLTDQQIWELLARETHVGDLGDKRAEKWGTSFPIQPPAIPGFHGERWVKSKGEDANYHYVAETGWELHVRKNDSSGYSYTIHYEISPDHSAVGHFGDVVLGYKKQSREQNRRIMGRSSYAEPVDFYI